MIIDIYMIDTGYQHEAEFTHVPLESRPERGRVVTKVATAELPDGFTAGPGIRGEGCGWEIHSDGATYWLRVYDGWATRPLVKIV
jgi:hypothetical protein